MTGSDSLEARGLTKTYDTGTVHTRALAGVDLTLSRGESLAVMGPSGSGKTTLLHVLAGILAPTSGEVRWRGRDLSGLSERERTRLRRSEFGFVFQSGQLLPELPADENAALPLLLAGTSRAEATARAREWLGRLGLSGMESRRPGELSGGQAQRVAIARALASDPGVIFADEPTGALDRQTGWDMMRLLTAAASEQGAALVVVTHDAEVARWCSRTVHMRDGVIAREARQMPSPPPTALGSTVSTGAGPATPGRAPFLPPAYDPMAVSR
ncbi:ABC transporter ATP-binding protein [Propionicicella superfundia]|uniref:ABC transporter ATP-binding protein n=1 Tax=Propionicicella superfundia TaxID=348582 RepID=UPI0004031936|nr:ABC transporter ATP-binding protein [Propionicicella superfundia]